MKIFGITGTISSVPNSPQIHQLPNEIKYKCARLFSHGRSLQTCGDPRSCKWKSLSGGELVQLHACCSFWWFWQGPQFSLNTSSVLNLPVCVMVHNFLANLIYAENSPQATTVIAAGSHNFFSCKTTFTHKSWLTTLGIHNYKQLFFGRVVSFWFMALLRAVLSSPRKWYLAQMTNKGHVKCQHMPAALRFLGRVFSGTGHLICFLREENTHQESRYPYSPRCLAFLDNKRPRGHSAGSGCWMVSGERYKLPSQITVAQQ